MPSKRFLDYLLQQQEMMENNILIIDMYCPQIIIPILLVGVD
jgi:hypothetical protein